MSRFWKELLKGLVVSNPLFIIVLGLCPALAISTSIDNALGPFGIKYNSLRCQEDSAKHS